jgi:hypothetical protein
VTLRECPRFQTLRFACGSYTATTLLCSTHSGRRVIGHPHAEGMALPAAPRHLAQTAELDAAMTIFRSFGEVSLGAMSSTSMFKLLIGTHQGTLWTKLIRAVSPSSAMFSSRRYPRWRRSFHNDSSDVVAKSQS